MNLRRLRGNYLSVWLALWFSLLLCCCSYVIWMPLVNFWIETTAKMPFSLLFFCSFSLGIAYWWYGCCWLGQDNSGAKRNGKVSSLLSLLPEIVKHCLFYINNRHLVTIFFQDKILQSTGRGHEVTVTNDGATILKSLHIDNPAAKILVGILPLVVWIANFLFRIVKTTVFADKILLWIESLLFIFKLSASRG